MQPPTIAFIGAGSTVFAKNLLGDIPGFPELSNAHVRLHDVDAARLEAHRRRDACPTEPDRDDGPRADTGRRGRRHQRDSGGRLPSRDRCRRRGAETLRAPARRLDFTRVAREGARNGVTRPNERTTMTGTTHSRKERISFPLETAPSATSRESRGAARPEGAAWSA